MTRISSSKSTIYPTIYPGPNCDLILSPQQAPQASNSQPLEHFSCLDDLVTCVMRKRYGDKLEGLSKKKIEQLRLQAAHSMMNRLDQKSSVKIKLPLAHAQGLVESAKERLKNKGLSDDDVLTSLAEFIFSDCKDFGWSLGFKLNELLGSESEDRLNTVFKEMCTIRDELHELTSSTMKLYRPPQETTGTSYTDHHGEIITLTQNIPSSADVNHPDVTGRCNLNNEEHVIYSTGRIETEHKALQVLYRLIHQTLVSGQIKIEDLPKDNNIPLYPVVVENLINATPFIKKEKEYLHQQIKTLEKLSGQEITITLPSGKKITVKLQIMHFSTQTNYNAFLGQSHGWSCTGSDVAEQITRKGTDGLNKYFELQKPSLPNHTQQAVEHCLKELSTCTNLRDRLMFRAFICELLNIPYHVHCKSSKDRTAAVAATKKALHLWLKIEAWKGNDLQHNELFPQLRNLFNSSLFREYSEAAFFENLPMTDQGVGFTGVLDGKLYTQNRGFSFQNYIFEHPFPAYVLTDRHLYTAPIVERVLYAGMMLSASIVLTSLYVTALPFVLAYMYYIYKEDCWEVTKYTLLALAVLPVRSGFRRKWLKRDSAELTERQFFLHRHKVRKIS